jgi:hypothetical protein
LVEEALLDEVPVHLSGCYRTGDRDQPLHAITPWKAQASVGSTFCGAVRNSVNILNCKTDGAQRNADKEKTPAYGA